MNYQKIPPQDTQSEKALLGSMMLNRQAAEIAAEILVSEDFYEPRNQMIFSEMLEIMAQNRPIDIIVLRDELENSNKLKKVGGTEYLAMLSDSTPSSTGAKFYAEIILEKSKLRRMISLSSEIQRHAYTCERKADDIITEAQKGLDDIQDRSHDNSVITIPDAIEMGANEIKRIKEERLAGNVIGIASWGITDLDEKVQIMAKRMYTIGALSGVGKTTFAINVLLRNAKRGVKGVLYTLEQDALNIGMNMLVNVLKIDNSRAQGGYLDASEMGSILSYNPENLTGIIRDYAKVSIDKLAIDVRKMKREQDIKFIIVDYLQRINASGENLRQKIIEVTNRLSVIAKENDIAVISLAQPNRRAANNDADHRPTMSDFAESSQIEKESWAVIVLHREFVFDNSADENLMEIIIRKNRSGRVGYIDAYCDMSKYFISDRTP